MPDNPNVLKNKVIEMAMARSGLSTGDCACDPFKAIYNLGDPMMPTTIGIAEAAISSGKRVILAGGTQMCCILAILKSLNIKLKDKVCIGTTSYLYNDKKSDIVDLVNQIDQEIPIYYIDLGLDKSTKKGLRAYSEGFVKEGAGAGGNAIAAFLNNEFLTQDDFLKSLEDNYTRTIEKPNLINQSL